MATGTEASATTAISLSENETKLFISIMKNLESDIAFNADAVAQECGYKSAKVVKDRWSQIKKNKLGISAAATPGKKAAPKKRKGEGEGEGAEEESPTKKAKTPKGKKDESPVKEEVKEEEGADQEE